MMNNQWLDDLQCLVVRFSHLGIGADVLAVYVGCVGLVSLFVAFGRGII